MDTARFKLLIMSAICFAGLVVLMLISGNKTATANDSGKMLVIEGSRANVMPVQIQQEYVRNRVVYGQIESNQLADIGFDRAGAVEKLFVEEGAVVKQGQALALIDKDRIDAQLNELKAMLTRAKADSKLAALNLTRVKDLVKAKLEPEQRLDEAQATLDVANASVAEAEARIASLEVEVEKSTLYAPFDGQIITQHIDNGTVVNAGQPIFQIMSNDLLEARFGLPENTAFQLEQARGFTLAFNNTSVEGQLKSIERSRSRATRTMDAIFHITPDESQPTKIVSGDIVTLTVALPYEKTGTWLPLSALANGVRGLWTVLVLDPESSQISSRLINAEYIQGELVYVSGALAEGDLVLVDGLQRFTPGQTVTNFVQLSPNDVLAMR